AAIWASANMDAPQGMDGGDSSQSVAPRGLLRHKRVPGPNAYCGPPVLTLAPRRTKIQGSNVCVPRKWATPTFFIGRVRTDVLCRRCHGGTTTHMREDEV